MRSPVRKQRRGDEIPPLDRALPTASPKAVVASRVRLPRPIGLDPESIAECCVTPDQLPEVVSVQVLWIDRFSVLARERLRSAARRDVAQVKDGRFVLLAWSQVAPGRGVAVERVDVDAA